MSETCNKSALSSFEIIIDNLRQLLHLFISQSIITMFIPFAYYMLESFEKYVQLRGTYFHFCIHEYYLNVY